MLVGIDKISKLNKKQLVDFVIEKNELFWYLEFLIAERSRKKILGNWFIKETKSVEKTNFLRCIYKKGDKVIRVTHVEHFFQNH